MANKDDCAEGGATRQEVDLFREKKRIETNGFWAGEAKRKRLGTAAGQWKQGVKRARIKAMILILLRLMIAKSGGFARGFTRVNFG